MPNFQKINEYAGQTVQNPYPDENQNPALKLERDYAIQYGKAMLAEHCSNMCSLPYAFDKNKRTFKELHQYATGTYPSDKIKGQLIGNGANKKKNGKWITKMNISWDCLPIIAKMLDVMREKNMRQEYDVDAFCVDDDSIQAKADDKSMLKYLVSRDAQNLMMVSKFKPQMKIDPSQLGMQNEQDVDLYFECGAYTFQREMASIAACNKTKLISKYKVIQDGTFDDLIKFGIAAWKNEIDPTTKTVRIRKCDVYNSELDMCPLIIPYSSSNNFDNLSKFAEIRTMTIADVRRENPNLNAQQLIYLAQSYSYLNSSYSSVINSVSNYEAGGYNLDPINRCKILVLDYQWLGVDIENYTKNENRNVFKPESFDFKLTGDRNRKGDRQIQKRVIKKFAAKWVIGTDILLTHGAAEDVIYYGPDGDRCPGLDYFVTKTGNVSLIERCIAIQDDIDLANVKLRNAIATAVPSPRMVIQTGLLDNVFLNNIKQEPQDNMATFRELGYLMVNAVDDDGKPIFTNQKLVDYLPMGIQEDINVFTGQILAGINNIREVLGIAQGADGSTPQKYDGVRKTELSAQSSNAALYPTFNCFQYLFEGCFNDCIKKWQIIAKDNDIKVAYSPLGQKNLEILSLDKDFTNADLNILLTLGATDQDLDDLLTDIKQLRAMGMQTNFQQGITTSEFIYLNETIRSGNTKQAMWVMARVEQKKIAAQMLQTTQNQQSNAQDQQNSAQVAELAKQGTVSITEREKRRTIILSSAEQRKTSAATALIQDFAKTGGLSAEAAYQKIIDEANSEVIGVLKQDASSTAQDQGQQQQSDQEAPNGPSSTTQPQQQVA